MKNIHDDLYLLDLGLEIGTKSASLDTVALVLVHATIGLD